MPSPHGLSKSGSEHGEQAALFCWLQVAARYGWEVACDPLSYTERGYAEAHASAVAIPELTWVFAIPNGGSRGSDKRSAQIVGAQMKAEGVKRGVSDFFVPIPRHGLAGLFVEMKRENGGRESGEQKSFGAAMRGFGFGYMVAHGWIASANAIMAWMGAPKWLKLGPDGLVMQKKPD